MREKTFAVRGHAKKSVWHWAPKKGAAPHSPGVITQQDIRRELSRAGGHTLPQTGDQGDSSNEKLQ